MSPELETPRTRWWQWWPLLIWIVGGGWVVAVELAGRPELHGKPVQEVIAIVLTAAALLASIAHLSATRQPLYLILSAAALAVMFREFHFEWTTKAVYIALAGIVFWAFLWRKRLRAYTRRRRSIEIWLIATGVTYVLSQAVARRGVQHLLGDDSGVGLFLDREYGSFNVYGNIEEALENTAHFMLGITALIGSWSREEPP